MSRTLPCLPIASMFLISSSAWAQIGLVQVSACASGAYPATTCTISSTGSGHLIVVGWASAAASPSPTIASVTDNAGNTYLQAGAGTARAVNTAANRMVDIWYAKGSTLGATTVTVTPNPSGASGAGVIWEFSNVDTVSPLDQTATLNSQPTTATPTGAPVTIGSPAEVVISIMIPAGGFNGILSGNPFTNDQSQTGAGWAHLVTTTAGTYTAQWSTPGGTYASSTVSFKAASGGGGGSPLNPCDLAQPYGTIDSTDVQTAITMTINTALGLSSCTANIVGSGVCTVAMVQRVVEAQPSPAGSGSCLTGAVSHSVLLNWTASITPNVTYSIYRAGSSGGPYTLLSSSIAATTYTDNTVAAGQTYFYVAAAVDSNNNQSSYSNQATALIPTP